MFGNLFLLKMINPQRSHPSPHQFTSGNLVNAKKYYKISQNITTTTVVLTKIQIRNSKSVSSFLN